MTRLANCAALVVVIVLAQVSYGYAQGATVPIPGCKPAKSRTNETGVDRITYRWIATNWNWVQPEATRDLVVALEAKLRNSLNAQGAGQWNETCSGIPQLIEGSGGDETWEVFLSAEAPWQNGHRVCGEAKESQKFVKFYWGHAECLGLTDDSWKSVAMHEWGHVIGLHHNCEGQLMQEELNDPPFLGIAEKECEAADEIWFVTEEEQEGEGPFSPLVLDIDGDGIQTSSYMRDPVTFDIDGDGQREVTGWIAGNSPDAFLWLDLNQNRRVDGFAELFGDFTILPSGETARNGFEALAVHDENGDRHIDPLDTVWNQLLLWNDWNHDGLLSPREVTPVADAGIASISLRHSKRSWVDDAGNLHKGLGSYVTADGRRLHVEDIWFEIEQAGAGFVR